MKSENKFRIQYYHRIMKENNAYLDTLSFMNYFMVNFPVELNIAFYDVISCEYIGDKTYRFVIKNNFERFPLYTLNEYCNKQCRFFKKKKDNVEIYYLNRENEQKYVTILKDIRINNIREGKLSYIENDIQTISFDVIYKAKIIEKNGTTN